MRRPSLTPRSRGHARSRISWPSPRGYRPSNSETYAREGSAQVCRFVGGDAPAANDKLGTEAWPSAGPRSRLAVQRACALADGPVAEAVCAAIEGAGERLAVTMPTAEGDVNELSDALVLID